MTELQKATMQALIDNWPGPIVPRRKFHEFSGGLFKPKTMANYDSLKKGPPRLINHKQAFYLTVDAAAWLVEGGHTPKKRIGNRQVHESAVDRSKNQ